MRREIFRLNFQRSIRTGVSKAQFEWCRWTIATDYRNFIQRCVLNLSTVVELIKLVNQNPSTFISSETDFRLLIVARPRERRAIHRIRTNSERNVRKPQVRTRYISHASRALHFASKLRISHLTSLCRVFVVRGAADDRETMS